MKLIAIFGGVDHFRLRAEDRNAGVFQSLREVQWCLPAELYDDAFDETFGTTRDTCIVVVTCFGPLPYGRGSERGVERSAV